MLTCAGGGARRETLVEVAIAAMKREGISDGDIDIMMRNNPARLLGAN